MAFSAFGKEAWRRLWFDKRDGRTIVRRRKLILEQRIDIFFALKLGPSEGHCYLEFETEVLILLVITDYLGRK